MSATSGEYRLADGEVVVPGGQLPSPLLPIFNRVAALHPEWTTGAVAEETIRIYRDLNGTPAV